MKKIFVPSLALGALLVASLANAVPVLQVGVPGTDPGTYAPYVKNSTNPTEDSTAITSGNTIVVGGKQEKDAVHLGGAFGGADWSTATLNGNVQVPTAFDTHGAILLITYSTDNDLSTATSLKISTDGGSTYHSSDVNLTTLFFPNNHAPLQDSTVSGYAYFDIGNFGFSEKVPNFADPNDTANGELKNIFLQFEGINWAHFDVMALETNQTGNKEVITTWDLENNPGSHDVTWKDDGGGGGGDPVPEPSTMILLGAGLVGLGLYRRKAKK